MVYALGLVDLDTLNAAFVYLNPATSVRNVIQPSGDFTGLTVKANAAQSTEPIFEVVKSDDTSYFAIDPTGKVIVNAALANRMVSLRSTATITPAVAFEDQFGALEGVLEATSGATAGTSRGLQFRAPDITGLLGTADNFHIFRFNTSTNKVYFGDTGVVSWLQSGHSLYFKSTQTSSPSVLAPPDMVIVSPNAAIGHVAPSARLDVAGANALASSFAQKWRNTGAELITATNDRTFAGAGNWTGTNWAVSGGVFLHTAGSTADAVLANANLTASQIVNGDVYKLVITLASRTVGSVTFKLGTAAANIVGNLNGAFTAYITATANDANLIITPTTDFDGSIDTLSLTRLPTVASVDNTGMGSFEGLRLSADPGSGVASTVTLTNDVAGTPVDAVTPTKWLEIYDGTTARYLPIYT